MQIDQTASGDQFKVLRSLITDLANQIKQLDAAGQQDAAAELDCLRAQLPGGAITLENPFLDEQRYRALFEQMTEGFALHEMVYDDHGQPVDYRFLEINPAFERLTGLARHAVIGRLKSEVLPGDDAYWVEIYGRVVESGQAVHFENYSTVLKQHYEVYAYRPAPCQFAVLFTNITARKRVEREAHEGKYLLDVLMENVPEGITIADAPDAFIRKVSRYGLEKLGGDHLDLPLDEVIQRWQTYHPDGVTKMTLEEQPLMRAIVGGETVRNLEIMVINANGERLYLLCNAAPIRDERGQITAGIVAWHDITTQKRAEKALRLSEERFRLASRAVMGVVYDWDILDNRVFRSEGLEQVVGFKSGEIPAAPLWWQKRIHPEDYAGHMQHLDEVLSSTDDTYRSEYRVQHRDGQWVHILDRSYVIRDDSGKPVRLIGSCNDISDRKRYEASLLESQRRERARVQELEAIMDATPAFVWIAHDRESRYMSGNRMAYESLRMQPRENISKSAQQHEIPRHFRAMRAGQEITPEELPVQMAAANGIPVTNYEFDLVFDSGEVIHTMGNAYPLFDEEGKPRGSVSAFLDITQLKRIEQALRESEAHFALTLANTSIFLFNQDRDLRYTWAHNPVRMFPQDSTIGLTDADFYNAEEAALLTTLKRKVLKTGKRLRQEIKLHINGQRHFFDLILGPLKDEQGTIIGITGAATDITEIRSLQQQQLEIKTQIEVQRRLQEYRELERRESARDIHDGPIQTLMSALINIQITKDVVENAAIQLDLEGISATVRSAVGELRDVVNQLRPPALIRFGLSRSITIHAEDFKDRHPHCQIDLDLPAQDVQMDEDQILILFRIYQEALNNIARHSNAKHIQVRYALTAVQAELEIQDDGVGFDVPGDLLEQTNRGHFGLAGMRERAEAVGGYFSVDSQPGKGARIRTVVPLSPESA
jgi:PAS domain S-box-containing protein